MAHILIADASPLIALSLIDRLHWLRDLFGTVNVVSTVCDEVMTGGFSASEQALSHAFSQKWLNTVAVDAEGATVFEGAELDPGEAHTIRYALTLSEPALLLMDERAGRHVARSLGLTVMGTAAVIALAKERGLIASVKAEFARLHAAGFWISQPVLRVMLARVGE